MSDFDPNRQWLGREARQQIPAVLDNFRRSVEGRRVFSGVTWDNEGAKCLEDAFGQDSVADRVVDPNEVVHLDLFVVDIGALHDDEGPESIDTSALDKELVYKGGSWQ